MNRIFSGLIVLALVLCGAASAQATAQQCSPITSAVFESVTCNPDPPPTDTSLLNCTITIKNTGVTPTSFHAAVADKFKNAVFVNQDALGFTTLPPGGTITLQVQLQLTGPGAYGIALGLFGEGGCEHKYYKEIVNWCVGQHCGLCPECLSTCEKLCEPVRGRPCTPGFCALMGWGTSTSICRKVWGLCTATCWKGIELP